jgi:hypothetical protein
MFSKKKKEKDLKEDGRIGRHKIMHLQRKCFEINNNQ